MLPDPPTDTMLMELKVPPDADPWPTLTGVEVDG
jgi:hypothetical protein